jgi:uncharacterized protein
MGVPSQTLGWRLLALSLPVSICFCQPPAESAAPTKPLRERLLERALKGDRDAQFDLGKYYETGQIGLPTDLAQARHWYREAANQGEPFAEASLGILFNFGKGVERDYGQAYMWYERAVSHLTGGDRETVLEMRDAAGRKLTPEQIAKARRLASEWKAPPAQ